MPAKSAIDKATLSASARIMVGDFRFSPDGFRTMAIPAHSRAARMAANARTMRYVMPMIIEGAAAFACQ